MEAKEIAMIGNSFAGGANGEENVVHVTLNLKVAHDGVILARPTCARIRKWTCSAMQKETGEGGISSRIATRFKNQEWRDTKEVSSSKSRITGSDLPRARGTRRNL